jgi:hypothetical protein
MSDGAAQLRFAIRSAAGSRRECQIKTPPWRDILPVVPILELAKEPAEKACER